jgi:hypothetical protein
VDADPVMTAAHAPRDLGPGDPQACSVLGDGLGESAYGTASMAVGWVALEQPGPWGRDAATQSHLDPGLGGALSGRLKQGGGRLVLVRRTGQHADDHHDRPRTVFVASVAAGRTWLLSGALDDPATLDKLDVDAVARGDQDAVLASLPGLSRTERPIFLLCTNGRRDVCCAVRGRPVAYAADAARPGQVWETSHTGGHRFAPTGVLLPTGGTFARLRADDVVDALDAAARQQVPAGLLGPRHDRGRSALTAVQQAAESAVRDATRQTNLDAIRVIRERSVGEAVTEVRLDTPSGPWLAEVRMVRRDPDRRVSCGKPPEAQLGYDVAVRHV